jgi:hydroxyacylglutathione hydrolase
VTERLSAVQAWESVQLGKALIVDVREQSQFASGHPQGALSLPFSRKGLEERLSILLQYGTPVILVAEDPDQAESALLQLQEGSFPVFGVVEDSINAWYENGLPMELLAEVSVHETAEAAADRNTVVLDVREPIEWELGHVPGALLISLGTLRERLHELSLKASIVVICEAGVRSSSAASILQAEGFDDVSHVPEGTGGYRQAGLNLEFRQENSSYGKIT